MIQVERIEDTVNPAGIRLTTYKWTYPKWLHGEVMTHRSLSKNAASSRAIPEKKFLSLVKETPALPIYFGANKPGMQAGERLPEEIQRKARDIVLDGRDYMTTCVERLYALGVHKQWANRYIEAWFPMVTLVSGTDWANFFALRVHKDAQPEFQRLAYLTLKSYVNDKPRSLKAGEWHLPYSLHMPEGLDQETRVRVSVGRCARLSYLNQDGQYSVESDLNIYDRLMGSHPGHWTPSEHAAEARNDDRYHDQYITGTTSNFRGYTQHRKMFLRENITEMDYAKHLAEYEATFQGQEP